MVKRVFRNEDVDFRIEWIDEDDDLVNYLAFDKYTITAYTTDLNSGNVYDRVDIIDYVLHMPWEDIQKLKNGQIKLRYEILIEDNIYPDGYFNKIGEIITRYYIDFPNNDENKCNCKCCY